MKTKLSKYWYLKDCGIYFIKNETKNFQKDTNVVFWNRNSNLLTNIKLPPLVIELMERAYNDGRREALEKIRNALDIK